MRFTTSGTCRLANNVIIMTHSIPHISVAYLTPACNLLRISSKSSDVLSNKLQGQTLIMESGIQILWSNKLAGKLLGGSKWFANISKRSTHETERVDAIVPNDI